MKLRSTALAGAAILVFAACGMPTAEEVVGSVEQEQVVQCTNGGCTLFGQECRAGGGDVVCLYANSAGESTPQQEKQCEHWMYMVEWGCADGALPSGEPCLNFEKMLIKKCVYVPTTVCVADPSTISDLIVGGPDACLGDCTEVLARLADPTGPQPTCTSDFQ